MARPYVKSKRARNQAETRQRIVEAAIELHHDPGPAQTTISMVAERAGVQRHTVYAHFPDERSLLLACSGLHLERHPLPAPQAWQAIDDPPARLAAALTALYDWYAGNADVTGAVLRDAEQHVLLREISGLRFGTALDAIHQSLVDGLEADGRAALLLALNFYTWRTLVRDAGCDNAAAARLMTGTVLSADTQRPTSRRAMKKPARRK